jgi:hypothetical protein
LPTVYVLTVDQIKRFVCLVLTKLQEKGTQLAQWVKRSHALKSVTELGGFSQPVNFERLDHALNSDAIGLSSGACYCALKRYYGVFTGGQSVGMSFVRRCVRRTISCDTNEECPAGQRAGHRHHVI